MTPVKKETRLQRIYQSRKTKIALAVLADIAIFAASFGFSLWVTDGFARLSGFLWAYYPICTLFTMLMMAVFKTYAVEWRFVGVLEVTHVIAAFIVSIFVSLILQLVFFFQIEVATTIIFYFVGFSMVMLYRIAPRFTTVLKKQFGIDMPVQENVIVYGAGYTGAVLVRRFIDKPEEGYKPVAIIDDDKSKHGKLIGGVSVVGGREVLAKTVEKYRANTVLIAISSNITKEQLIDICHHLNKLKVKIKVTSSLSNPNEVLNSKIMTLDNLNIGDLLHRDEHKIDEERLNGFIKGRTVLVTGGAGSIGSEICRQAMKGGCEKVIVFDHSEFGMFTIEKEFSKDFTGRYKLEIGSVRDREKVRFVMEKYKPDVVFHAAAYKHVPMMEFSADEAIKNNVIGTENVIEQCNESGVKKFILISTDKAINPANVMGASKRIAELVLEHRAKTSKTILAAVRFGNVLGSSGSVIPIFMEQINQRKNVTVTHEEMRRYFMTIPEAVKLVIQAGAMAKGGEVFILDMGDPVYIKDLAEDLIRISGLEIGKDIDIEYTGLREGEKLFEELSYNEETADRTSHDDIFVCKLKTPEDKDFYAKLEEIKNLAKAGDKKQVEEKIFALVPSEYRKRKAEDL